MNDVVRFGDIPFTRMYGVEQSKSMQFLTFSELRFGQIHPVESERHRELSEEN